MKQVEFELMRCNLSDIISIMDCFQKLFTDNIFDQVNFKHTLSKCEMYLNEYLSKQKMDITGA